MGENGLFNKKDSIKEETEKLNFKIKTCWPLKDTIKKIKWQATEWKKIVTIHLSGKGLDDGQVLKDLSSEKCKLKPHHDSIIPTLELLKL